MPAGDPRSESSSGASDTPIHYGKYFLVRKLAEGGMAEIYLAKQLGAEGFERNVVIKRMLKNLSSMPDFVEMFLHEAKLAARLSHQNIVQIYDLGLTAGHYYICMEYLPGEDFSTVIRTASRGGEYVPLGVVLRVIIDAARGLHFAHELTDEQGRPLRVVHRDISPSNLYVTYQGQVKVLDFGIAKAETQIAQTNAGMVKGKYMYMAPEQARGKAVDRRADVYSLGVTLYEALTSKRPFARDGDLAILNAVLHNEFKPPRELRPDLPVEIEEVVLKAMAGHPERRYASAEELATALESFMQGNTSGTGGKLVASYMRDLFGEERIAQKTRIKPLHAMNPAAAAEVNPDSRTVRGGLALDGIPAETPRAHRGLRPWASPRRWLMVVCATVSVVTWGLWALKRPQLQAERAAHAIRSRIARGQLLLPPGDNARDLLVGARAKFPERGEFAELTRMLCLALGQAADRAMAAGAFDQAIQALEACVALAPDALDSKARLQQAEDAAFASRAGMVQVGKFWIDRYEYPNIKGTLPMTKVDWEQAEKLCQAAGKRLCTESEWEAACVGPDKTAFPYGNQYIAGACQVGAAEQGPVSTGSKEACVTASGIADLSGNVAEWTSSQVAPSSQQRVVRGGSWRPRSGFSCVARDYFLPGQGGAKDIGFRCCR